MQGIPPAETRPGKGGQRLSVGMASGSKERGRPPAELRSGEELERHGWRSRTWALAGVPVGVQV